jgi:hypothetical protein
MMNDMATCYRYTQSFYILNILKHDQQDATLYNTLLFSMLYMFRAVFPLIIRSSNLYMQHQVFVKLETCRALTVIKSIIKCCILLVMLKNTLTMHSPMNVKSKVFTFGAPCPATMQP